jgi:hypothetical protein
MIELVFGVALLVSYVLLFYNYHLTGRTALVYYALAWFSLSVPFFVPRDSIYVVGLAFFAALIWLGNLRASEDLLSPVPYSRELRYFSLLPIAAVIFLFPENTIWALAVLATSIAVSALFLLLTGIRIFRLMSVLEILFALASFFGGYYFFNPYFQLLVAFLAVFIAYVSIRAFLDSSFIGEFELSDVEVGLKPGLFMMSSISEDLFRGALVFSRRRGDAPNWFWVTKISGERSISPTNLPKMLDIAVKFMKNASEGGKRAVVILDCLEYLTLENGFSPVLKFLTTLRDYAVLHDGTVIILGDDSFLEERERRVLRKLLD